MRKKQLPVLEGIRVEDHAAEGKSLARHDGKVIFIEHAVPGDLVDVRLTKSKKDWAEGFPVRFIEYSKERVEPFCQHFGVCGGCQWQMLPYAKQLEFKQKQVYDNLTRIGKVELPEFLPIVGAKEDKFYRNKLEYTFSTKEYTKEPPTKAPLNPPKRGTLRDSDNLEGPLDDNEGTRYGYETADIMTYGLLKEFVHQNRSIPTEAENVLWQILRGKSLEGYKFRRQHIIGRYIADFVNLPYRLVIEVDGLIHQLPENKQSDEERTMWLRSKDFEVIRFTNEEVLYEGERVLGRIVDEIKKAPLRKEEAPPPPKGGIERDSDGLKLSKKTGMERLITPVVGFHAKGFFDKVVDIQKCWLQDDLTNTIRNRIREYALETELSFYDIRAHVGFLRTMQVRICTTGEVMVNIVLGDDSEKRRKPLLEFVQQEFPQITTLLYTINLKWNDSMHDLEPQVFSGKGYVVEELDEFKFKIGPKSFFQTNTKQGEELYKITREFAELDGSQVVYDLYCGTGSIGIFCSKHAKKIVGVEMIEAAIADAKENAQMNGIEHTFFAAGDVIEVCNNDFFAQHGKPDVIITDPPRAGMHEKLVLKILEMEAPTVVYVSCNPATQARDLNLLDEKYRVTKVQPVDMFPHTHHIENVVQLKLKTKENE